MQHSPKSPILPVGYGFGCLLVNQRTANVAKTILNQCNTVFAMRTFDDTGKAFLANYLGSAKIASRSPRVGRMSTYLNKRKRVGACT